MHRDIITSEKDLHTGLISFSKLHRTFMTAVAALSISVMIAFAQTTSYSANVVTALGADSVRNAAGYGIDPTTGLRDPWLWPFASTSPWNIAIGSGARYSSADEQITKDLRKLKPWLSCGNWSMPFYLAASTDPVRQVIGSGSGIPGDGMGNRLWGYDAQSYCINFPADAKPDPGESTTYKDGHLFIVTPDHSTVTEMYFWDRNVEPTGTVNPLGVIQNDLRGNGWGCHGERAMSSSAFAGIIRVGEIAGYNIPHVITFAVSNKFAKSGPVWPSTTEDSFGLKGRGEVVPYGGEIAMGTLIAIPPSVDITTLGLIRVVWPWPAAFKITAPIWQTQGVQNRSQSMQKIRLKICLR